MTTPSEHPVRRTAARPFALRAVSADLRDEFSDLVEPGTVERLLFAAYDEVAGRATITAFLPLLAHRLAREQLRSLTRPRRPFLVSGSVRPTPDACREQTRNVGPGSATRLATADLTAATRFGPLRLTALQYRVLQSVADGNVRRDVLLGSLEPHLLDGRDVTRPLRGLVLRRLVRLAPIGPPCITRRGIAVLNSRE